MQAVIDAVRRPEYTGENRCWPCTAVNVVVVAVVGGALAVGGYPAVGLALAGLGGALVALRGYLIPYTPRFAPRLVAHLPGDLFHEAPQSESDSLVPGDDVDGEALLATLTEAGVVEPSGESLALSSSFRERWRAEMDALAALDGDELADAARAAAPTAVDAEVVEGRSRQRVVLRDRDERDAGEGWLSRPVAIAEVAAVRALPETVSLERRTAAARLLRMFLETCPACDGAVVESTTATCCGGLKNPREGPDDVLVCSDCDVRLFTF